MDVVGAAALRCWPVDVTVAGMRCRIPATPATSWMMAMREDWTAVVPGMLDDDDEGAVLDHLATGRVSVENLVAAARDAVEAAAGYPWWVALNLVSVSLTSPDTLGEAMARGASADQLSLGAWCTLVYRILTRDADDARRRKVEQELTKPPPTVRRGDRFDADAAAAQFNELFERRRSGPGGHAQPTGMRSVGG